MGGIYVCMLVVLVLVQKGAQSKVITSLYTYPGIHDFGLGGIALSLMLLSRARSVPVKKKKAMW